MTFRKLNLEEKAVESLIQQASHPAVKKPEIKYENTLEYWRKTMLIGDLDPKLLQKAGFPRDYKPLWQELLGRSAELSGIRTENRDDFKSAEDLYAIAADFASRLIGDRERAEKLRGKMMEMYEKAYTSEEKEILIKRFDKDTIKRCVKIISSLDNHAAIDEEAYKLLKLSGNIPVRSEVYAKYLEAAGDYRPASAWYAQAAHEVLDSGDVRRAKEIIEKAENLESFSRSPGMIRPYYFNENTIAQDIYYIKKSIQEQGGSKITSSTIEALTDIARKNTKDN